tara:strand:- start:348 stop:1082 length:735 start_codon:yes stop_codon:yes gene_type:complete
MINKLIVQSIIDKYYLGTNESVKWVIENNSLNIDFMTPTKDVIGNVTCNNFELEDSKLAIYDTKKLNSLISICNGDLLLELEKRNAIYTKLKISDLNFNLNYALSDPLLIGKVGEVNEAEWVVKLNLTQEDVVNIIKSKSALAQIDNMLVTTTTNLDGENVVEFVFGDESGHNNKITYQVSGDIKETDLKLPFNSDTFKTILQANKDMDGGELYLSSMGLMRLNFGLDNINSKYFMVRKAETEF